LPFGLIFYLIQNGGVLRPVTASGSADLAGGSAILQDLPEEPDGR
jgi:hypothetical protein